MGSISLIWGLFVLGDSDPANASTGYIMIGLGLVCYSISSKVILLSKYGGKNSSLPTGFH